MALPFPDFVRVIGPKSNAKSILRNRIISFVSSVCIVICGYTAYGYAEGPQIASDSPIAFDGAGTIYAVATDRRTIIRNFADALRYGDWRVLGPSEVPVGRITGLVYANGALYVSAVEPASIVRIDPKSGEARPIYVGRPFLEPSDISVVDGVLFVSDSGSRGVFRLLPFDSKPELLLSEGNVAFTTPPFYLAGWENGLIIASPNDGTVTQIDRSQLFTPSSYSVVQQSAEWGHKNVGPTNLSPTIKDITRSRYPDIRRPGAVSICRGIVYVINQDDHQIYAFSRFNGRAVRIAHSSALAGDPRRLLVTDDRMFVVDATAFISWPRLIPVDIALERSRMDATLAFYEYLLNRELLPSRMVPLHGGLEKTLRDEHVLVGDNSPELKNLICKLNTPLCPTPDQLAELKEGQSIKIPDLSSESYIDVRTVSLDGSRTLGEEADRRIFSPDLKDWVSEDKLSQFNEKRKDTSCNCVRGVKNGEARLPVEMVRYSVALPASDVSYSTGAHESSYLFILGRRYGLRITPAEEVRASAFGMVRPSLAQQAGEATPPNNTEPNWQPLKSDYTKLVSTIHYYHPELQAPRIPVIGIAESEIDCTNPDFDNDTCQKISEEVYPVEASASVARVGSNYILRPYEPADHGTAVAALVAARRSAYNLRGLASPEATVVPMRAAEPAIGDDVRSAYVNYNVRIFNFSFNFPSGVDPLSLRAYVDEASETAYKDALFVVAAGNEGKQACSAASVYPVCWGQQPNVLVVGATKLDGTALMSGPSGSNWSDIYVHVAAPGDGFHSSGRNKSYVPVSGTSFATPLVTATAGLLYAENVTDPWLIKQRIVATSDRNTNFKGKLTGGLLNVKRAVSYPTRAVTTAADGTESEIYILPGAQNISFSAAAAPTLTVPLRNIRRVISNGDGSFEIFYADPSNNKLLRIVESARFPSDKASQFQYKELGQALAPTGSVKKGNVADFVDYVGPISQ
jgi:hypothetical protein